LNNIEKFLNDASLLCEDGKFRKAILLYDEVLRQQPDNLDALIDKGVALQNLGRLKQADRKSVV